MVFEEIIDLAKSNLFFQKMLPGGVRIGGAREWLGLGVKVPGFLGSEGPVNLPTSIRHNRYSFILF